MMARISHKIDYEGPGGCWVYSGFILRNGYGQVYDGTRRNAFAHRAVFEAVVGPIPAGLQLDHICRNRACVNPDHLEPVTAYENLLRADNAMTRNMARTHCRFGHPLSGDNIYRAPKKPSWRRECALCHGSRHKALKLGLTLDEYFAMQEVEAAA